MEQEVIIKNIDEVIEYLKDGYVLGSYIDSNKYLFVYKKEMFYVYSSTSNFVLNEKDFISIYTNNEFNLIKTNPDELVDEEKDIDYYQNLRNKQ